MAPEPTSVVWFRRDLRLHDHPALASALADGDRVAPLFVLAEARGLVEVESVAVGRVCGGA